jgi:guanine nucleotide-binding protein subunit alpha
VQPQVWKFSFAHGFLQQAYANLINADPEIGLDDPMPMDCLAAFNSLWADKGVQLAILKGNQYALHDNLS